MLEPDPDHIGEARTLFEQYGSGRYSDDTLALEAAARGFRSPRTGRPMTAAGIAELLRNPAYNGYLVRFRGFADEERIEAPWRHATANDGSGERIVDPPVSDELWERVQAIRTERATVGSRSVRGADRVYIPNLYCHGCGSTLRGHATAGRRRMYHLTPVCASWEEAAGRRASFRAEIYEWQVAALLATASVDDASRLRIVAALGGVPTPVNLRRVKRLENELRAIALDNALGRLGDDDYLRRKAVLSRELVETQEPAGPPPRVEPERGKPGQGAARGGAGCRPDPAHGRATHPTGTCAHARGAPKAARAGPGMDTKVVWSGREVLRLPPSRQSIRR